ncbi:MAG TPA: peptidylprolyl isomerase [Syntrophorhabdaceae bacterium]|jgi:peptidyl-prolyl cis-trans isomerase SurA
MKIFAVTGIIFSLLLPLSSYGEVVDRVVAIVNDDIITLKETEKYVPVEKKGEFVSVSEYLRNIKLREKMDILIDDLLIRQQAKRFHIEASDKDADSVVEGIKKQHLISEEDLKRQLQKDGISYKDFYEGLKSNILRTRVLARMISSENISITEGDVEAYYNSHLSDFKDEEFRLLHVFVSGKRPDIKDRALAAYNELKEGKSFESVAKKYSDDPSAEKGGDIGFIRKEDLIPEFKGAVNFLVPGGYTQLVSSPYGLHILKLVEVRQGGTIPFDTVKPRIKEKLVQEQSQKRYKEYIEKLRKASYIEVKI